MESALDEVLVSHCTINHDVLFNNTLDFKEVKASHCSNCLNCGYPLNAHGLFFDNQNLIKILKDNQLFEQYINSFSFPKNVIDIPLNLHQSSGKACCEGCALRIIEKERRGSDAELKIKTMMSSNEKCIYFNKKLLKMYGGMKSNFFENAKLSDTKYLVSKHIFKNNTYVDQPYCIFKEKVQVQGFDINKNYIWNKKTTAQQNKSRKKKQGAKEGELKSQEDLEDQVDSRPPPKRQKSLKHLADTSMAGCSAWKF